MSRRCFTVMMATLAIAMAENRVIRYDGPGNGLDYAADVAVGPDGNVYVAGASTGSGTGLDFTILCVSPEESLRWVYRWNRSGSSQDVARAVAVGPDGNVYAAGYTVDPVPYYDVAVLSLTPDGALRWATVHAGEGGGEDSANAIAIDSAGNIYTAGVGDDIFGENTEFSVLSFEPDSGRLRWAYTASADYIDEATDVVAGPDSTIFASGVLWSGAYRSAFVVAAVNSVDGSERWFNSLARGDDDSRAAGIACHDGKVYAAGWTGSNFHDFTVTAYDADSGGRDWAWYYSNSTGLSDQAYDITVGPDGTVYACGRTIDSTSTQRYTVASLTPGGATRWLYCEPGGPDGRFEEARALAVDEEGRVYTAGWSDAGWPYDGDEAVVLSLDTAGTVRWVYRYDPTPESVDVADAIAVGPNGRVYAAGTSWASGTGLDIVLFCLDADPPGVTEQPARVDRRLAPNATIARGVLLLGDCPRTGTVPKTALLDISGREVLDLRPGPNDVSRLAPGVYFVRAVSREPLAVICQKVVLTR